MTDDMDTLELADMDAWESFVNDNREALLEQYDTIAHALKVCCDGGMVMGGGACPVTHVFFTED